MSSPLTPKHSRQSSNIDSFSLSLSNSHSRAVSRTSAYSPINNTHTRRSLNCNDSLSFEVYGNGLETQANGLGNLADELADAWDEDEDPCDEVGEGDEDRSGLDPTSESVNNVNTARDSGIDVSSPLQERLEDSIQSQRAGKSHRKQSSEYDGSEYGNRMDYEADDIPDGLQLQMDAIESLVRRGTENNGSERDEVVKRVIEELKDLGAQSRVEGGASRLITAHSALSTHLLHETRLLQSLTYPLFSPLTFLPNGEFIDELTPLLASISETMPRPSTTAFNSLMQLHSLTADLIQTLNYLSDTLHMTRQTTTSASRRLRSARELVAEMRKTEEARKEGQSWLQRNNCSERLHNRECAKVCSDVLGGFDEVCNGWRARLVAQAEAVAG